MKTVLISMLLLSGQIRTLQDKPTIFLPPHQNYIPAEDGGNVIVLKDAPLTVQLPQQSPTFDSHGRLWSIDVANTGPKPVTIVGRALFSVQVRVNQTVHIQSSSAGYSISQ